MEEKWAAYSDVIFVYLPILAFLLMYQQSYEENFRMLNMYILIKSKGGVMSRK